MIQFRSIRFVQRLIVSRFNFQDIGKRISRETLKLIFQTPIRTFFILYPDDFCPPLFLEILEIFRPTYLPIFILINLI